jgi:hypothetical protein
MRPEDEDPSDPPEPPAEAEPTPFETETIEKELGDED